MAIWRSTLGQSALKAAVGIVAAEVEAELLEGEAVDARLVEIRDEQFAYLEGLAKQDDEAYASLETASSTSSGSKPSGRASSKGGTSKGRSKGKKFSVEDAEDLEMNSGPFRGQKLGTVVELSEGDALDDFSYTNGSGEDYIAFLSSANNRNGFTRDAAEVIRADRGIAEFSGE